MVKKKSLSCLTQTVHSVNMVQPHRMEQVVTQTAKLDTPRVTGCQFGAGATVSQSCGGEKPELEKTEPSAAFTCALLSSIAVVVFYMAFTLICFIFICFFSIFFCSRLWAASSRRRCLSGSSSFMILSFSALFFSSRRVWAASWR